MQKHLIACCIPNEKLKVSIALSWEPVSEFCMHIWDQWITQCYLPPSISECIMPGISTSSRQVGTQFTYTWQMECWVELVRWLCNHPNSSNLTERQTHDLLMLRYYATKPRVIFCKCNWCSVHRISFSVLSFYFFAFQSMELTFCQFLICHTLIWISVSVSVKHRSKLFY